MNVADQSERATARAETYALLAALLDRPLDRAGLDALRDPQMSAALAAAGVDPGPEFASLDTDSLRERLSIEFSDIFVAPVGKIMPHEGLMLDHEDDLSGETPDKVTRFMAGVGYRLPSESGYLPDHIAVELTFVADLARREAAALAAGDAATATRARDIRRDFLIRHLGRWAGICARRVAERAGGSGFYPAITTFMADFVADDMVQLTAGEAVT